MGWRWGIDGCPWGAGRRGVFRLAPYIYIYDSVYTAFDGRAVRFTWDVDKAARNRAKHGLDFSFADFSLAEFVFADPLHLIVFDRHEAGEERWHCVGAVAGGFRVLLVVHCYPDPDDPELVQVIGL